MISKFKKFIFLLKAKSKYNNETYNKESLNSFENRVYIDISQYDPNVPARLINNRINELYHSNKNNNQILIDSGLPKATFYRIINDFTLSNKPTKENIIKLAVGLECNLYLTLKLLNAYGYTFSNSSRFDITCEYFFKYWKYQIDERGTRKGVNELQELLDKWAKISILEY